jgi:hypothetical protein
MRYHNLDNKKHRFILVTRDSKGQEVGREVVTLTAREKLKYISKLVGDSNRDLYHYVNGSKVA